MSVLDRIFRRIRPEPARVSLERRLQELEIVTARLIRAGFAGQYHAAFHGRGIEFSQVREYYPGDDIRTIDWNVTARSGIPHVKQFVEERDLTVVLAIDVSGSMRFGSLDRRKIDVASELAAVMTFAALQNKDRVGLLLFSDDVIRYVPPRRGRLHSELVVRTVLEGLDRCAGRTRFDAIVEFISRVLARRAVLILLSDFLDWQPERSFQSLARRNDLICIGVTDPREERMPATGIVRVVDAESGRVIDLDLSRNPVGLDSVNRVDDLRAVMGRFGVDFLEVSTAIPYERDLIRFFGERQDRVGRRRRDDAVARMVS